MLQNLNELETRLQNQFNSTFYAGDRKLPDSFKVLARNIEGAKIEYFENTFVVDNTSRNKIYFPNQLWFLAAYFADLYLELEKYMKVVKSTLQLSDDEIKRCKGNVDYTTSLVSKGSLSESDKDNIVHFLSDYSWWNGGKGAERADYFYSPILSMGGLVNASQGYVAELTKYLSHNSEALKILQAVNKNSKPLMGALAKQLILESKNIADFMGGVTSYLLDFDRLDSAKPLIKKNDVTIGFPKCGFGKLASVFNSISDERRKDDCDKNIIIDFDGEKYYFLKEQTINSLNIFAENLNDAYANMFIIEISAKNYRFYKLSQGSSSASHINALVDSSDPTEFVWSCIKLFNNRKELETLFASKYKSQGGSQGNYVKINNCYVAQEGQLLVDDVDNIQIFDGSYLNDNFDAREVDLFRDAINDVFAGKYEISISGDEGEEVYSLRELQSTLEVADNYRSYIAALRTKPFMLLAGISGTGKSRIVREMAKACWSEGEEEFGKNRPKNFCMVQVKPNWHDSSELIGYISRINGEKFVVGPFLKFMARAIQDPSKPYFLCLDEMNLAPVEQYFAEYLSVIESRKVDDAGNIVTDPLIDYEDTEAYKTLIDQLFDDDDDRKAYLTKERGRRLTIPQNLFVIGTVNMDETTYSFSRKVLDRAMTIEMNEVNLDGGLDKDGAHEFAFIPTSAIVGTTVEGCDVYSNNSTLCDFVIKYLTKINAKLDGTPFKIAYRTRNEFLVYAVNRLLIAGDDLSSEDKNRLVLSALDEMTSMKILSRIEGDETRTRTVLRELHTLLEDELKAKGIDSMSLLKIDEMLKKLDDTQYTSYWA